MTTSGLFRTPTVKFEVLAASLTDYRVAYELFKPPRPIKSTGRHGVNKPVLSAMSWIFGLRRRLKTSRVGE